MIDARKSKHVQNDSFDPRAFGHPNVKDKQIGAPEVQGHFEFHMHNIKLTALKHILVFIPQEDPIKTG